MRVTARSMLDAEGGDKLIPFVVGRKLEDPEVRELPLFKEVIEDPKKYSLYKSWADQMDFQRPFSIPPGTPKDRLQILRKAFAHVLKDDKLVAEAKKSKLVMTYVSGEKTEKLVKEMLSMPADIKHSLSCLIRSKHK